MTVAIAALLLFATLMATGTQRAEAHTPEVILIDCLGWSVDLWDYNESTANSVEIWVDGDKIVDIADFGFEYRTAAAWSPLDPHTLRVKVVAGDGPGNPDWSFDRTLTSTACPNPAIDIEKATNGEDADSATGPEIEVGGAVTWTYVVTNTGDADLIDVVVTDDLLGAICTIGDLAVGASETCTATGTATEGQYANEGTVTGTDPRAEVDVTDTDPSHYIGVLPPPDPNPSIDIEKATNGEDADAATGPEIDEGDTVTWTYVVTNTGNVDLTNVVVTDDIEGAICTIGDLAVGASATCTATGIADVGQYANLGTVTGIDPQTEIEVTDTDPSHHIGVVTPTPAIDIEKATNGVDADSPTGPSIEVGGDVTWTYVVTNTGDADLTNVAVTDDIEGAICTIGDLAVGASATCTATGIADVGQYANLGTVTGIDPQTEIEVTDTDPSHYTGISVGGTAQLGDTVWLDTNKNGVQDAGEAGLSGACVDLTDSTGNVSRLNTGTSPWVGFYKFVGLDAGTYTAAIDMTCVKSTYELTTLGSFTVTLVEGEEYLDADFGLYEPPTTTTTDPTTTTTTQPSEALPDTGVDSGVLIVVAVALLMLGGLAVAATRRRTTD